MPLLTVVLPPNSALSDALRVLRLRAEEVDREYGLIALDPATGRFALRVTAAAAARLSTDTAVTVFADPPIGSMGPGEPPG